MFRTDIGADEGMLFPSREPMVRSFWMKNTPLSLDIIFIGPDRRIINIAANTTPYSLDSVVSDGPAVAVLELVGGRAAELGIGPGDKVDWRSEEHTSELQSLMRISYADFCLKKKRTEHVQIRN